MNATMSRPAKMQDSFTPRTTTGRARRPAPSRPAMPRGYATLDAEVSVTLPAGVLDRLRAEARGLGLSLEWVAAAFVAALTD